ncbi:PBS lyase HEAT-like repeat protein [Fischerella sp. NIES-4106]|nr:PBS lyase HEAT-like repeat protein [Fischerella sp. NIES-4106]
MLTTLRPTKKPSPFILYPLAFILSFLFSLAWVNAEETPKPQDWQINGIVSALDDGHEQVKGYALQQIGKYKLQDIKKTEDIAQKAANILKDEKIDASVRASAASALGNLGEAGAKYAPDILNFLKDQKEDAQVRASAAYALGNLGEAGAKYAPDILNFLKDEKVNADVRGNAASALENLKEAEAKYVPDILNFLKDQKEDAQVRASVAYALGKLGEAGAKYAPDLANILKDQKADVQVRASVAYALGKLGEAGAKYAPDLANILKDQKADVQVRASVAYALGKLGEAGAKYALDLANILKDQKADVLVRCEAARALGNLEQAAKYAPDILNFLKDQKVNTIVCDQATSALGNLGEDGAQYAPDILDFLKDQKVDAQVRASAAYEALTNLGQAGATKYAPDILNFLKDQKVDAQVRASAASGLGNLGKAGAQYAPDLANILKDQKEDAQVRASAASGLGNLEQAAKYAPDLANILKDQKEDAQVRASAASGLGNLEQAAKYAPDILNFLKDQKVDAQVRREAASVLGNLEQAAKYAPDILNFLKDQKVDASVRGDAAEALKSMRQLELAEVVVVLNYIYEPNQGKFGNEGKFEYWRFLTYFLGGGTEDVKTLLKWVGNPPALPDQIKYQECKQTLEIFRDAWQGSPGLERFQKDLADKIANVAQKVDWQIKDVNSLQTHQKNLQAAEYTTQADAMQKAINKIKGWQLLLNTRNTILFHIVFWLALIFAYPKFPQVQAIFFWNPWVRRILGVGYVGFLLTWVPFLRRKLFEPFKFSLLADAGLDNFQDKAYFPESLVKVPPSTPPRLTAPLARGGEGEGFLSPDMRPITQALPSINGQIVLIGDSGLGKSMFLRHLLKHSQRIVVFLPAQKCDNGVIEAIQKKLHGQAQDAQFLKNLIYSGAIDICIDGLNEITADTRAKITQFVEYYFRGNIIMTTQPLEWIPPSTAKIYYLQPLEQTQIHKFLISRQLRIPQNAQVQGADYEKACEKYLVEILKNQQPSEELAAVQRILSNPMDLTVVALMLSQGKQPDLFHLQEQQYKFIAAEYLQEWNQEFPLKKFAEAVYQMRLHDQQALPAEEFYQVLMSLEDAKYKMVVSRQWKDDKGEAQKQYYFRHDKIMDFFLVQKFLGNNTVAEARLIDHMGDPRFRGVYFLLATLLPLDEAKQLREKLIQYAADTKDHTVSDTFVQLLRTKM